MAKRTVSYYEENQMLRRLLEIAENDCKRLDKRIKELEAKNEILKLFVTTLKEKAQFAQIPNYVLIRMCEQALKGE